MVEQLHTYIALLEGHIKYLNTQSSTPDEISRLAELNEKLQSRIRHLQIEIYNLEADTRASNLQND